MEMTHCQIPGIDIISLNLQRDYNQMLSMQAEILRFRRTAEERKYPCA